MKLHDFRKSLKRLEISNLSIFLFEGRSIGFIHVQNNDVYAATFRPNALIPQKHYEKIREVVLEEYKDKLLAGIDEYEGEDRYLELLYQAMKEQSPPAIPPQEVKPYINPNESLIESLPTEDQQQLARSMSNGLDLEEAWQKFPLVPYSVAREIYFKIRRETSSISPPCGYSMPTTIGETRAAIFAEKDKDRKVRLMNHLKKLKIHGEKLRA